MAVQPPSQPAKADAHRGAPSGGAESSLVFVKQRPAARRRRRFPGITLPLAILVVAATFSTHVVADSNTMASKMTTPLSSQEGTSSASNDDDAAAAVAAVDAIVSVPARDERLELRARGEAARDTSSPLAKNGYGELFPALRALFRRDNGTSDGDASPALPSPFDNLVPFAFQIPGGSTSCPNFMASLLSSPTFKDCYPISMLMQTSKGFFNAQRKHDNIVQVLDASCAPDVTRCVKFMTKAAQNLTSEANCKNELDQKQTQVSQAYRGLRAYSVLYAATCLKDPASDLYCFANAVTNTSTPSNTYLYFMPLGLSLPGASRPTCNWCTKTTMGIFHAAAADREKVISSKYEEAAQQINMLCGPSFVNSSLPAPGSGGFSVTAPSALGLISTTLFALVLVACLL